MPRLLIESALSEGSETVTERRRLATELFKINRVTAGIGLNMNQAAKHANTVMELPANFTELVEEVRQMIPRWDAIIQGLIEANKRDGLTTESVYRPRPRG